MKLNDARDVSSLQNSCLNMRFQILVKVFEIARYDSMLHEDLYYVILKYYYYIICSNKINVICFITPKCLFKYPIQCSILIYIFHLRWPTPYCVRFSCVWAPPPPFPRANKPSYATGSSRTEATKKTQRTTRSTSPSSVLRLAPSSGRWRLLESRCVCVFQTETRAHARTHKHTRTHKRSARLTNASKVGLPERFVRKRTKPIHLHWFLNTSYCSRTCSTDLFCSNCLQVLWVR